jgi:hypothetical protein
MRGAIEKYMATLISKIERRPIRFVIALIADYVFTALAVDFAWCGTSFAQLHYRGFAGLLFLPFALWRSFAYVPHYSYPIFLAALITSAQFVVSARCKWWLLFLSLFFFWLLAEATVAGPHYSIMNSRPIH